MKTRTLTARLQTPASATRLATPAPAPQPNTSVVVTTDANAVLRIGGRLHVARLGRSKELRLGAAPDAGKPGRVPRIARLLALAWKCEELVRNGTVADYATAARLGHITRARMSQIMNLIHLAPDIQEEILFLPAVQEGRDPIILQQLQPIAKLTHWNAQRKAWAKLRDRSQV